jgi:hypothetical protein
MNLDISKKQSLLLLRILYPVWLVVGLFTYEYLPSIFMVAGDAAATAVGIAANEMLFRVAVAGSLLVQLIHIAVVLVLVQLFKDVDKVQTKLLIVVGLIGVPIAMVATVFKGAALFLLSKPEQMMFWLDMNLLGITVASIFWGLWLLPQGVLILKSGWFPKVFGYLMILAGVSYTVMAFVEILFPSMTTVISILSAITMGEVMFMAWVMFMGARLNGKR